jgi:site-specific recombinase XerD
LKEVAEKCNINKNISSHTARHIFATTIGLENGIPLEIVSKMLGHTSTRTTLDYAKVNERFISNCLNQMINRQGTKQWKNLNS